MSNILSHSACLVTGDKEERGEGRRGRGRAETKQDRMYERRSKENTEIESQVVDERERDREREGGREKMK